MRGARWGAAAVSLTLAAAAPASAEPDRATFLSLLHDGRFEAAGRAIREHGPLTRPDDLFFDAFMTWWRLVFDDDNLTLKAELESRLDATVAAAESRGGTAEAGALGRPGPPASRRARASERRPFAAAFEAKRAKRLLEAPAIEGKAHVDALFGVGTYNYIADTVPSYVKGLRALLFLPKGNRIVGLNQLAAAAAGSRYFAFEARTLLVTIYANQHERLYDRALEERDRLITTFPDCDRVGLRRGAARSVARPERRGDRAAAGERKNARTRSGDVDPVVLRSIELVAGASGAGVVPPGSRRAITKRALAAGAGLGAADPRRDLEGMQQAAVRQGDGIGHADEPVRPRRTRSRRSRRAPGPPDPGPACRDAELRAGRARGVGLVRSRREGRTCPRSAGGMPASTRRRRRTCSGAGRRRSRSTSASRPRRGSSRGTRRSTICRPLSGTCREAKADRAGPLAVVAAALAVALVGESCAGPRPARSSPARGAEADRRSPRLAPLRRSRSIARWSSAEGAAFAPDRSRRDTSRRGRPPRRSSRALPRSASRGRRICCRLPRRGRSPVPSGAAACENRGPSTGRPPIFDLLDRAPTGTLGSPALDAIPGRPPPSSAST